MRIPFKIVLGLLLFNAIFALYNPLFDTGYGENAKDINNDDLEQYDVSNITISTFINIESIATAGIIAGVAFTAALLTKNYVYIGVGIFVGVVTSMYSSFMGIISQIGTTATSGNIYVTGIISLIGIAIGVIIVFNVVDMFAPHPT